MLRGREHGHIHSDFRDDANGSKGLDTRHRHNKVELRKVFLRGGQDKRFQVGFAQFKTVHVGTDDAELFSLFDTHLSVHGGLNFLNRGFEPLVEEGSHIKGLVVFQEPRGNSGGSLVKWAAAICLAPGNSSRSA